MLMHKSEQQNNSNNELLKLYGSADSETGLSDDLLMTSGCFSVLVYSVDLLFRFRSHLFTRKAFYLLKIKRVAEIPSFLPHRRQCSKHSKRFKLISVNDMFPSSSAVSSSSHHSERTERTPLQTRTVPAAPVHIHHLLLITLHVICERCSVHVTWGGTQQVLTNSHSFHMYPKPPLVEVMELHYI